MQLGREISPDLCRRVAEASLNHLFTILKPSGKFIYSHKLGDITQRKSGYNLLRHCGTLWFMCLAVKGLGIRLNQTQAAALGGAVAYVANNFVTPPWLQDPWPCLGLVTRDSIKIGGVGLALAMLHEYHDVATKNGMTTDLMGQDIELTIAQLENYALSQISAGDFIHKRDYKSGRISEFRSDYYTGEAIFGLIHGGRNSPLLRNVIERLMQKRYGVDIQSHWMAYAACKAAERQIVDPKIVQTYLIELINSIVRNPEYRKRNQSTPIACRSEALCCFLHLSRSVRPAAWPFPGELVDLAKSATAENLLLQLKWYDNGQFWRGDGDDKVQIDYVQHNGTAFLNWYLLTSAGSELGS